MDCLVYCGVDFGNVNGMRRTTGTAGWRWRRRQTKHIGGSGCGCGSRDAAGRGGRGQILQSRPSDTAQAGDIGGIRPEFREAMDRCEAFFDEYAEFMEKYQSADDAIGMLADYADYLDRYVETMEEMEAVGQEELSEEELVFYMQVMLRIQEKLSGTLN